MNSSTPKLLRLPPGRALWALAWPVIALGLFRSGYHLAAVFWAGHLPDPTSAQAAIGATAFAVWILMSIAELASVGVHTLIAQAEGARERWRIGALVTQGAWVAALCGGILMLFAKPICRSYLDALHFQGSAFEIPRTIAQEYLLTLLRGSIVLNFHTIFSAVFRGIGDTRTPMVISAITLILNAIVDPVLMFGWAGAPAMGLAGAGWATVFANSVGIVLYWIALRQRGIFVERRRPSLHRGWQIVRIGGPSTVSGVGFCLVYVVLGELLTRFGPAAIAGLGLGHRLEGPSYQICVGFGAAAATLVGQHLGAREPRKAIQAAHRTARWAIFAMAPLTILFLTVPQWLVGRFSSDTEAIAAGASYLLLLGLVLVFVALEIVYENAFAGSGETWIAMLIVVLFTSARIPLAWWLADRMGLIGVWVTIMGTCALKGLLLWGAFSWRSRQKDWGRRAQLA